MTEQKSEETAELSVEQLERVAGCWAALGGLMPTTTGTTTGSYGGSTLNDTLKNFGDALAAASRM